VVTAGSASAPQAKGKAFSQVRFACSRLLLPLKIGPTPHTQEGEYGTVVVVVVAVDVAVTVVVAVVVVLSSHSGHALQSSDFHLHLCSQAAV